MWYYRIHLHSDNETTLNLKTLDNIFIKSHYLHFQPFFFFTRARRQTCDSTGLNAELNSVLIRQTAEHTAVVLHHSTDSWHSLPALQNILSPWDNGRITGNALLMSTHISINGNCLLLVAPHVQRLHSNGPQSLLDLFHTFLWKRSETGCQRWYENTHNDR